MVINGEECVWNKTGIVKARKGRYIKNSEVEDEETYIDRQKRENERQRKRKYFFSENVKIFRKKKKIKTLLFILKNQFRS